MWRGAHVPVQPYVLAPVRTCVRACVQISRRVVAGMMLLDVWFKTGLPVKKVRRDTDKIVVKIQVLQLRKIAYYNHPDFLVHM